MIYKDIPNLNLMLYLLLLSDNITYKSLKEIGITDKENMIEIMNDWSNRPRTEAVSWIASYLNNRVAK